MINVLISCSGGFSSSLVISKFREAAKKNGIEVNAWAINSGDFDDNVDKADIVLVAPQIQYMYERFKEKAAKKNIPCLMVSQIDYGRCDGGHILDTVLKELKIGG